MESARGADAGQLDRRVAVLARFGSAPDRQHVRSPGRAVEPGEAREDAPADLPHGCRGNAETRHFGLHIGLHSRRPRRIGDFLQPLMQRLGEACGHGLRYGKGRWVTSETDIVPDSERRGLIGALPAAARPYASLIRLDRPIGAWLLFWPCAWSVALAGMGPRGWALIAWLALGAWAMRGAGCVYNDIVDKDLDARVERTRLRPLASKRVSLGRAWALLGGMSLIGLLVLLQLPRHAEGIALLSLFLVACYPFMKRISWWPQAWLGLVFSWGALVGWAAVDGRLAPASWLLWAGSVFWVIGYDTIYALQDREDDALAGVRSSALALGRHARLGVALCYLLA